MAELASFVPYRDPFDSPSSENAIRFWEDPNPDICLDPQSYMQTEPIPHPPLISESSTDEIVFRPDPSEDLVFWDIYENPMINGDPQVEPADFLQEPINQEEEENVECMNTGYDNAMPLSSWPPPPPPVSLSCSFCRVLREIIHTNSTYTTKLEVHGRVGVICHAILEIIDVVNGMPYKREHQMFDLSKQSLESVKQFLMRYCQERRQAGCVMSDDPLSTYYDAICAGLMNKDDEDDDANMEEFMQPSQTDPGVSQMGHPRAVESDKRLPTSSLAAQRQRTGKLGLRDLGDYFHLPIQVAAKNMAICPTVIKKICRKHGLKRWPHRKIKRIDRQISDLQQSLKTKNREESAQILAEIERLRQERAQLFTGTVK